MQTLKVWMDDVSNAGQPLVDVCQGEALENPVLESGTLHSLSYFISRDRVLHDPRGVISRSQGYRCSTYTRKPHCCVTAVLENTSPLTVPLLSQSDLSEISRRMQLRSKKSPTNSRNHSWNNLKNCDGSIPDYCLLRRWTRFAVRAIHRVA